MADPSITLEVGRIEDRYWQEYAKRARDRSAPGQTVGSVSK
jgi:hypothetical protein